MKTIKQGSVWRYRERTHESLLDHLCHIRGLKSNSLVPNFDADLHDPNLLPDMERARELLRDSKKNKWHVTVFGDYDADGTPAAALLSLTLKRLNINHDVMLPTRQSGYGLKVNQVEEIAKKSQLLITVDTGTSSVEEITRAKELGLAVIVLDHHLSPEILPPADALVNPHLPTSNYPFVHLCGCAVAYKFVCALRSDFPEITESFTKWLLDLVAISTVADMMPIVGENRVLVHYGLIVLRQNRRPGIQHLLEQAGIDPKTLSATTLGYSIGPRLNASGRLGDNRPAYELLIADEEEVALKHAVAVEKANKTRQTIVDEVLAEARELVFKQNNQNDYLLTVIQKDWPSGVVGLVAGRLASEYNRPVIVGTIQDDEIRASARSIEKYPIVDGLQKQSKFLLSYGGHKQAAGLSLKVKFWDEFSTNLKVDANQLLVQDDLRVIYTADSVLDHRDLSLQTATSLESLQPFGLGNAKPLFILPATEVESVRFIGAKQNHFKATLRHGTTSIDGISFNMADRYKQEPLTHAQFLGYLENNRWNGKESLQFHIVDYREPDAMIEKTHG